MNRSSHLASNRPSSGTTARRLAALLLAALAAAPAAAAQELEPAQERRLGERQRALAERHEISGLGARGPERIAVAAQQLDPAAERALALALHAGTPLSAAPARAPAAGARGRGDRAALPSPAFTPPSLGYAAIALLALGGLLVGARRHQNRVIVASAFERLSDGGRARALR